MSIDKKLHSAAKEVYADAANLVDSISEFITLKNIDVHMKSDAENIIKKCQVIKNNADVLLAL